MDIKEKIGDDEYVEYRQFGEFEDHDLILNSGHKDEREWRCYSPRKLYEFLKKLDEMGVLKDEQD
jgi:hypothetical protein